MELRETFPCSDPSPRLRMHEFSGDHIPVGVEEPPMQRGLSISALKNDRRILTAQTHFEPWQQSA